MACPVLAELASQAGTIPIRFPIYCPVSPCLYHVRVYHHLSAFHRWSSRVNQFEQESEVNRGEVMAPDRGSTKYRAIDSEDPSERQDEETSASASSQCTGGESSKFLADQAEQETNFTLRGVLVGLAIGVIICFSNTYFGLQTGWVSGMAMPSALIGFAYFKSVARFTNYPFTPVENVLVVTVAGAVGTMPLGCGFVGVLPALNYLLMPEENGPLVLSTWKLIIWAIGICFFGVVIAVPLRRQVLIREKLKFPSGTATALIIGVLHGNQDEKEPKQKQQKSLEIFRRRSQDTRRSSNVSEIPEGSESVDPGEEGLTIDHKNDWKQKIKLLLIAFAASAVYTLIQYFVPQLRELPILGSPLATNWLWTLNPSPAYVGQGKVKPITPIKLSSCLMSGHCP